MNKSELIDAVANTTGKTKADVKAVIDAVMEQVINTVKEGDEISALAHSNLLFAKPMKAAILLPAKQFRSLPRHFLSLFPASSSKMP